VALFYVSRDLQDNTLATVQEEAMDWGMVSDASPSIDALSARSGFM
jgi:hypothetical protein